MRRPPRLTDEQEAVRLIKQDILLTIGAHAGAWIVATLRENNLCDCLGYQLNAIEGALKWAVHGEDVRKVKLGLECFVPEVTDMQADVAAQVAFAETIEAIEAAGGPIHHPDTGGRAN